MENTIKLGWIGLGNMGIPMAKQVLSAKYPLTVFNRNPQKNQECIAIGAKSAGSPAKLMDEVDVLFIMVSDDQAINDIFLGNEGILTSKASNRILINMSTVSPEISIKMADLCKQTGNYYLDAPVSGSVKQAEQAQLVIMVGGDEAIYRKTEPLFSVIGKMSLYIGNHGAGNTAKLAINTLLAIQAQGLAETLSFAEKKGIEKSHLTTLINASALGSVFMKIKGESILNENYGAVFALKHIAKDLRLAKNEGISSPLANTVYDSFQAAEPDLGEEDIIAIAKKI